MTLSSLTSVSNIPENSYATPGLWNSQYSIINQDFRQLNSDISSFSALTKITYAMMPVGNGTWDSNAGTTITISRAVTLTNGPLTVSAGGLTVSASGITVTGNSTITGTLGGITTLTATTLAGTLSTAAQTAITSVGTLTALSLGGTLTFTPANSKVVPGATNHSLRNNADSADNILIADAGAITFRGAVSGITTLSAAGALTLTAAASQIVPGATSLSLRNNANSADNLILTDAGLVTTRNMTKVSNTCATFTTTNPALMLDGTDAASITFASFRTGGTVRGGITYDNVSGKLELFGGTFASGRGILLDGTDVFVNVAHLKLNTNAKYFQGINAAGSTYYRLIGLNASDVVSIDIDARGVAFGAKMSSYNAVTTAGWGVPSVYASARSTAQTGDVASIATYTVGAADGSFQISSNFNVTAYTAGTQSVQCTYTDETNTARTFTFTFSSLTGTLSTTIGATGPYESFPVQIRCKASTAITIKSVGTAWTGTYNVEGQITQTA